MSSINKNIDAVRRLLGKPKENAPNVDAVLGSVLDEFQTLYNELSNSQVAWTTREFTVDLNGGTDYPVSPSNVGKILFATLSEGAGYYPASVEFTDLADASQDWWTYYPNAVDRPEDAGFWNGYGSKIAFYRKNGSLYARARGYGQLTVTAATGDFTNGANLSTAAVLPEYHNLVNVRAAISLLPSAEWKDEAEYNENMFRKLMATLPAQEQRIDRQFQVAKRSLVADDLTFVETYDDY
jgi:hypothetical protein